MVRISLKSLLGVSLCVWMTGCVAENNNDLNNATGLYIVPQAGEGIELIQSQSENTAQVPPVFLYATVPDNYIVSQVINHNLDRDSIVEQMIFYKDALNGNDIRMLVIDYDRRRDSYIHAWAGRINSQNTASLNVNFVDMTHDGNDEILVYSRAKSGLFMLEIFSAHFESVEAIISLRKIGEFSSESTIGVEWRNSIFADERDDAPLLPQVITEEQRPASTEESIAPSKEDEETENVITVAQLKIYEWSQKSDLFDSLEVPVAPYTELNQQLFQHLAQASVDDLLDAVDGNWMAFDGKNSVLMIIDAQENTINIQIGERQVAFQWKGQFKTITKRFPAVQMTLLNQNLSSLQKNATIMLLEMDRIRLYIRDELGLNHTYDRVEFAQSTTPPVFISQDVSLDGWYEGFTAGERVAIYFNKGDYILQNGSTRQRGRFVIYTLDQRILEFVEIDNNHLARAHTQYLLDYRRERKGKRLLHAVELTPVAVVFDGYRLSGEPSIQLVQTTTIVR